MQLLKAQQSAKEKLSRLKVGALFMEAGTGKTRAALELIKSANSDYILWLTPYQTKANLKAEINKWGGLNCQIEGIESLSNSDKLYLELNSKLEKASNAFIVADESLKIKNSDAKRTQRIIQLGKLSTYKLILNGTPLSRNLLDLWSQMEFLSPKILGMNHTQFKNTFCEYVQITYSTPGRHRTYSREFIKEYHNLDYLYSLIEPYVFESQLSISVGRQNVELTYKLTEEEEEEHNRIKDQYLDDKMLMARNNNIFLELTQKMQHNYSQSPEKFKLVNRILKDEDPKKVLIYAKYIDTQERLKKEYPNAKIMSLGKHAYGLNLQDYNKVVFFDKTWDYAQREQVERRVYRQGQKKDCVFYDLNSNAGLDSLINQSINKKANLLDQFKKKSTHELKKIL